MRTEPEGAANETGRIEGFSDGVFAFAMTLLILNIHLPYEPGEGTSLASALAKLWPSYLTFLTSFATIGIMWINHHRLFKLIGRSDQMLLILNGLLLLSVTFVPFPTEVAAEFVLTDEGHVALMFYSGTVVVIAVVFTVLWRYASSGEAALAQGRYDAGG